MLMALITSLSQRHADHFEVNDISTDHKNLYILTTTAVMIRYFYNLSYHINNLYSLHNEDY